MFDIHEPRDPKSKANLPFAALKARYKTTSINDNSLGDNIQVFWGLANSGNYLKIKTCIQENRPWMFVDMPYWHRWTKVNPNWSNEFAHWRFVPGSLHPAKDFQIHPYRYERSIVGNFERNTVGKLRDTILITPSSNTVTRFVADIIESDWIQQAIDLCKVAYPDYRIKVRVKPRAHGTSGPDVASVPIENDLERTAMVIASASMTSVDALAHAIPTATFPAGHSPIGKLERKIGDTPTLLDESQCLDRLRVLADHQYSPKEVTSGLLDGLLECYTLI